MKSVEKVVYHSIESDLYEKCCRSVGVPISMPHGVVIIPIFNVRTILNRKILYTLLFLLIESMLQR